MRSWSPAAGECSTSATPTYSVSPGGSSPSSAGWWNSEPTPSFRAATRSRLLLPSLVAMRSLPSSPLPRSEAEWEGYGEGGSHHLRGDGNSPARTETRRPAAKQRPRTVECWAPRERGKVAALFNHLCVRGRCPSGVGGTALHDRRLPRCTALVAQPRRDAVVGNGPPRSNPLGCHPPIFDGRGKKGRPLRPREGIGPGGDKRALYSSCDLSTSASAVGAAQAKRWQT